MARVTQPYKNSFSGSVGSGLGSLFGGSGKHYFILEHKISSRFHKAGESQEIIIDRIELGRDPKCQVRFDESFTMVSRHHAAIVREGDKWKIVQLSETNPTFLNGVMVRKEWFLQNGDEIQLAVGGPKLGFIMPSGNRATVGTIGLSRRLSLFRQQALRPYKQAMTAMGAAICVLLIAFAGWSYLSWQKQQKLIADNVKLGDALNEAVNLSTEKTDSLAMALIQSNEQSNAYKKDMNNMQQRLNSVNSMVIAASSAGSGGNASANRNQSSPVGGNNNTTGNSNNQNDISENENVSGRGIASVSDINNYSPFVFAITLDKTIITYRNGRTRAIEEQIPQVVGTGFMLNDGRFITARHVLEKWYFYEYIKERDLIDLNIVANNGGSVVAYFTAISSSGKRFSFNSSLAKVNRTTDKVESIRSGHSRVVVRKAVIDNTDWAVYQSFETSGFQFNTSLSTNLQIGAELEILGFPYGRGAESIQIAPIYSTSNVAKQGLDVNGTIMVSNDNTERGNAGGPVLIKNDGAYQIVGVMSGSTFAKGRIVPISAVH